MDFAVNGVKVKFKKYSQENVKMKQKEKDAVKCDIDGKELVWQSGNRGHYVYVDTNLIYEGEVFHKDMETGKGKLVEKIAKTTNIDLESCKLADKKVLNVYPIIQEEFCVIGDEVFGNRLDNGKVLITAIQQKVGTTSNIKIGMFYKDIDGVITLRLCSAEPKSVQQKEVVKIKIPKSDKVIKKASLDMIGIKV